jgi:hypothetical protein
MKYFINTCQLYWGAVEAPEPNEENPMKIIISLKTVTTKKKKSE